MIRWGIIGTGDVAERKGGPALYQVERSSLVAVTNRTLARAEKFAKNHGGPTVHASAEELLADAEVDAVYIATPPDSHAELTVLAAQAGKHVLCEKPMAMSVEEGNRMIEACNANNVSLSIAFYRREFPVVRKMKSLLDSGAIGRPLSISAQTYAKFFSRDANPWRLNKEVSGGGFLMDMGTHRFDLFTHFFGRPTQVSGYATNQTLAQPVDDAATVSLKYADDVLGTASFQWNSPVERDSLTIVGTEGILSTDSLSSRGELTLETIRGTESWSLPSSAPVHLGLVEKIVAHLLDGGPNPCSGEAGIVATEIVSGVCRLNR